MVFLSDPNFGYSECGTKMVLICLMHLPLAYSNVKLCPSNIESLAERGTKYLFLFWLCYWATPSVYLKDGRISPGLLLYLFMKRRPQSKELGGIHTWLLLIDGLGG